VGKGQHIKLEKLVAKPFSNWKNAIESFNEHARHEFHLEATRELRISYRSSKTRLKTISKA
jgi:hypothetical protein